MRIPVAVLGATGAVGQRMVQMLACHPWFELVQVCASEASAGKPYGEAVHWILADPVPEKAASMQVTLSDVRSPARMAFSALDSSVAREIERAWAASGITVITNASPHRMDPEVPLIVPEVNPEHLDLVRGKEGMIIANPNCVVIGLALALKPLVDAFGVKKVNVTTFQALSGAGYPGVSSLSICDNVLPHINGEEEKVESEPVKIFSRLEEGRLIPADLLVSASCVRVPVLEGHVKSVSLTLEKKVDCDEVKEALSSFRTPLNLPSAPHQPLCFLPEEASPQPRLHRNLGHGMTVSVGSLRSCPINDYKFFVLSHNTIRGAAGGSILLGELVIDKLFYKK